MIRPTARLMRPVPVRLLPSSLQSFPRLRQETKSWCCVFIEGGTIWYVWPLSYDSSMGAFRTTRAVESLTDRSLIATLNSSYRLATPEAPSQDPPGVDPPW